MMTFQQYVPNFLIVFVGVSALRSTGDYYLASDIMTTNNSMELYNDVVNFIGNDVSKYA